MSDRWGYDAGLPVYAAWSCTSPVFTTMLALQVEGNETRVIGSKHWQNQPLSVCIREACTVFDWGTYDTHVVPSDPDYVYIPIFERLDRYVEAAPKLADMITPAREMMLTLKIDRMPRAFTGGEENNQDFVDSIGQHAPRVDTKYDAFVVTDRHNLPTFYMRAVEVFAAWRHIGNARPGARHRRPNYRLHDRAVV